MTNNTKSRGRLLFWLGLLLAVLGIAAYIAQVSMARLTVPWYMPIMATVGAVLVLISVWQRRSVFRIVVLVLITLLAGAEWAFLTAVRLPAYAGPVAVGRPFPSFATLRSDGVALTQRDLEGDVDNVMVFFRGRW